MSAPTTAEHARCGRGLPLVALVALAALAVPRVVLHDLDLAGGAVNAGLAIAAPIVWVAVVLARGVRRPFKTLLAIGLLYGALLAMTHQVLWNEAFDGRPPRLGDQLADAPDWVHEVVTRGGAVLSSLVIGLVVGAVAGVVGTALDRARSRPGAGV